jgi:membrane protein
MKFSITKSPAVLRDAFDLLRRNDPLILSSSTAFFATFSLSPIIVILVNVFGIYFQSERIRQQLFAKLEVTLGQQTTLEIEKIVNNFMAFGGDWWVTASSFIFLLFVATTLLGVVRKALHQLWHIRRKASVKLKYNIKERLIGLGLLVFIGLLFLVSLMLDTSLAIFREYIQELLPGINRALIRATNIIVSIAVVTTWFAVLFKVLPEARMHWRIALVGGFVTGLLFSIGKLILGRLLIGGNLTTIFGASASIVLLLLFIFYSALIMYYGAAFTYSFAKAIEDPIMPGKYADEYEEIVVKH